MGSFVSFLYINSLILSFYFDNYTEKILLSKFSEFVVFCFISLIPIIFNKLFSIFAGCFFKK
jgi:hypothetical protein